MELHRSFGVSDKRMADPDDLVRREKRASREPSTQEEWVPTEKTIAIIAIITAIIAIISDFFSK